jgi:DNA-binding NarL/FixJ family response regulator
MLRKRTARSRQGRRRILIVDDHPLIRRGLAALINAEPDLIVCAEAATLQDGLVAIAVARPDLVISDLSLIHGDDGLELVRDIRSRHLGLRILVLSTHDSPLYVRRAFAAGADGYLAKHQMTEMLLPAVRSVLRGETYGAPEN